jgi:drug/metabolite transporter (DMT)-like permease
MTSRNRAELFLLFATFIWGGTFVIIKLALNDISPIFFVAIRFFTASSIFLLLLYKTVFPVSRSAFKKGMILGVLLLIGFIVQTIGLTITTASKSGFITGMLVVFTPLFQVAIEKRIPKIGNIIGVVCVAIGLYFLTSPQGSEFNLGDFLTLCCAIVYALYIIYLDLCSEENISVLIFLQLAVVGVGATLYAFFFEEIRITITTPVTIAFLYTTFLATMLTTFIQTKYQKETTPTRAAVIFSLEPVVAAISAYYIIGDKLGIFGVFGGALIVAGFIISETSDSWKIFEK